MWQLLRPHRARLGDDLGINSRGRVPPPARTTPGGPAQPQAAGQAGLPGDTVALTRTARDAGLPQQYTLDSTDQRAESIRWFVKGFTPAAQERAIQAILRASAADPAAAARLFAALEQRDVSFADLIDELGPNSNPLAAAWHALGIIPLGLDKAAQAVGIIPQDVDPGYEAGRVRVVTASERALALKLELLALLDPVQTPLAKGIDRDDLFTETLQDLASPTHIAQGGWGTCGATSVQIALALRDPVRYVQLVRALASPSGDASTLVPGMARPGWDNPAHADAHVVDPHAVFVLGADRSITVRLLSVAFMSYATQGAYDGAGGLDGPQESRLLEGLLGWHGEALAAAPGDPDLWTALDKAQQAGHVVPVELRWAQGNHAVLYAGTAKDSGGREYALLLNPWGKRHAMPLSQFQDRIFRVHLPSPGAQPIPRPQRWDDLRTYEKIEPGMYMTQAQQDHDSRGFQKQMRDFVSRNGLSEAFARTVLDQLTDQEWFNERVLAQLQAAVDRARGKEQADWEAMPQELRDELAGTHEGAMRTAGEQAAVVQVNNLQAIWHDDDCRKHLGRRAREALLDLCARNGVRLDSHAVQAIGRLAAADRFNEALLGELRAAPAALADTVRRRAQEV